MKGLSIEQKAKAYDEAIERANSLLSSNELGNAWIYKLLPELKESEDEKIRKSIINLVIKSAQNGGMALHKWESQQMIAWLENQGNANKEYWKGYREGKQEILDKYAELEKQGNINPTEDELEALRMAAYEPTKNWSEKLQSLYEKIAHCEQCEQKPTDKIEPKFKVGDWIVFNGLVLRIGGVSGGFYVTTSKDGITNGYDWSIDNAARLWTIQDAKDGDILFAKGSYFKEYTFIYSGMTNDNVMSTYCGFDMVHNKFDTKLSRFGRMEDFEAVSPTTKEQRDLLFQKMKGAGYVWDTEDKQLKKIEQKHTPKHKVGDTIYYNSFGELKSMIVANVTTGGTDNPMYEDENGNAVFEKDLVEQKPAAWSEEDDKKVERIIRLLQEGYDENCIKSSIDWLINRSKFLRPQSQWKPSDKDIFELQCVINNDPYNGFILKALLEQLKKLGKE